MGMTVLLSVVYNAKGQQNTMYACTNSTDSRQACDKVMCALLLIEILPTNVAIFFLEKSRKLAINLSCYCCKDGAHIQSTSEQTVTMKETFKSYFRNLRHIAEKHWRTLLIIILYRKIRSCKNGVVRLVAIINVWINVWCAYILFVICQLQFGQENKMCRNAGLCWHYIQMRKIIYRLWLFSGCMDLLYGLYTRCILCFALLWFDFVYCYLSSF